MADPLIPPPLAPGDTIAIVAPSGRIRDQRRFNDGVRILRDLGFMVIYPPNLWPGSGYFADTDEKRAAEFNRTWANPEVKALIAARGGFGCLRILDRIDLPLIRQHPKLLIGFSDITVLQNHLQQETGLVSLHGPVLTSLAGASRPARERLFHCLTGNWSREIAGKDIEVLRGGRPCRGILGGGNLSSIISLLGTCYQPQWKDKVVFLEDTGEPLYRIDRMLTQLALAGMLHGIAGLILGDFSFAGNQDPVVRIRHHEGIWQRTLELTAPDGVPVWGGFPTGHSSANLSLPVGAVSLMNSDIATLQFC